MEMQNGNWSLSQDVEDRIDLVATIQEEVQLNLTLDPAQPHVTFGEKVYQRKAPKNPHAVGILRTQDCSCW